MLEYPCEQKLSMEMSLMEKLIMYLLTLYPISGGGLLSLLTEFKTN